MKSGDLSRSPILERAESAVRVGSAALALVVAVQAGPAGSTDHVPGRVLVRFRAGTQVAQQESIVSSVGATRLDVIPQIGVQLLELPAGAEAEAGVQALRARPEVSFAELDRLVPQAEVQPNDPFYAYQTMSAQVRLPQAWSTTTGSAGVTVAIVDGGVDASHPDIAPNIVPGWNFYDDSPDTSDIDGHGTKAAGTVGAVGNNAQGVAGCAWTAKIMPIRTSNPAGQGEVFAISKGLVWAADHGARVANLGYDLGDTTGSAVSTAAEYFQSRGGVVTTAAGNDGASLNLPSDPYLLVVSAITPFNTLTSWSNSGTHVDLSAPETSWTTIAGGGYGQALGTSYSSAFVAGVAALALSVDPTLTGEELRDLLTNSSDDLGPAGWDPGFGWGRLNAERAVAMALGAGGGPGGGGGDTQPPTVEITSPKDGAQLKGSTGIKASASDNVGVVLVEFYVDGKLVGKDQKHPFASGWRAKNASKGAHTIQCKAYDAAGNVGTSEPITVYL